MKPETKEQREIEDAFILLDNSEEVDDIPKQTIFRNLERMLEMFDFFRKIPIDKAMKVKFPNELLFKAYNQKLRYYASKFKEASFIIRVIKNQDGYFIYIKKVIKEDKNEENLEVESVQEH